MAALDFDTSKVVSDVIPKGEQRLVISSVELKPTKANDGLRLNLKFTVCGGQYANRSFFEGLNIKNKNATAQAISENLLKKICEAIGVSKITDSNQLLNGPGGQISKPFMGYIDIRETDEGLQNVLKKPKAISGTAMPTPPVNTLANESVPPVAAAESAPWATA